MSECVSRPLCPAALSKAFRGTVCLVLWPHPTPTATGGSPAITRSACDHERSFSLTRVPDPLGHLESFEEQHGVI